MATDSSNRVYFVIANNDTQAVVATSIDHGATWQNLVNVSDIYGLKNIRYPAAIAGNVAERLDLRQSLGLSSIGILVFVVGWLLQQAGRGR